MGEKKGERGLCQRGDTMGISYYFNREAVLPSGRWQRLFLRDALFVAQGTKLSFCFRRVAGASLEGKLERGRAPGDSTIGTRPGVRLSAG